MDRVATFAAGHLHPVVDQILPSSEIGDAHRALESRQAFGKTVLTVQHPDSAFLVMEVADSSLRKNRLAKVRVHAREGVPEYP